MPRIFDNIDLHLLPALQDTLHVSERADFCVGYFNLRGWRLIGDLVEEWDGGDGRCCRLLVGMQPPPEEQLRSALSLVPSDGQIDQQTVLRLRRQMAEQFRNQLMMGAPSNADEEALRCLSRQIKAKKVVVKLFLRFPLHAKLYLLHRPDPNNPSIGFLGSSNLTLAGLAKQGELNVDVLDHDACQKLQRWFDDRWNDHWCLDISDELAEIIDTSWAREDLVSPYEIYLKMAYHLSQEARAGLSEFRIPRDFGNTLLEFQNAAVKIAARHLNRRGGVLLGDVVGLGKTLMATALARIFEDDFGLETLILCPPNLIPMWEDYRDRYRLRGRVLSLHRAIQELPNLRRYRVVVIDESHNLRNREGRRYRAIQEYIRANESKCILLSATPYNKTYLDLSSQLRLFVDEREDLGIRPEQLLQALGETEFIRRHQASVRSLAAFEHSEYADDWRELMRLYLVRRTRSFIRENYAECDPGDGREFLTFEDGTRSYFSERIPRRVPFTIDENDPSDQYARLFADDVVDAINHLALPRYGLANYISPSPHEPPTTAEGNQLRDLSRAGGRLIGFCRTNLFKRLESSGQAFLQSVERHVLRNFVYLHAITNDLPIPIGTQEPALLDSRTNDEDDESGNLALDFLDDTDEEAGAAPVDINRRLRSEEEFRARAAAVYAEYASQHRSRFKWVRSSLFVAELADDLVADANALRSILEKSGDWEPQWDAKLNALEDLIVRDQPNEKVLVFTQFADTVRYLDEQLRARGLQRVAGVTGESENPTALAWRFSPVANLKREAVPPERELRIVIATDVLSEGQNLQDCSIVVNYDLPWAIIRLIQRVGRIDRIGQQADRILCYSFLPADGVEHLINLRQRVRRRLSENAEVVGSDEAFFDDDGNDQVVLDLYHEKATALDGDVDAEVDLASYAYQIWKNATDRDHSLKAKVENLPNVVFSTRAYFGTATEPEGVLLYMRTAEGNDSLAWIDEDGNAVSQSQLRILQKAECAPNTPAIPRGDRHHELVQSGVEYLITEESSVGGQLGRPSGARFRTYERLKAHAELLKGTIFESQDLLRAIEDVYRYPLTESAKDVLNRQLRSGVSDEMLADLVLTLREEDRLCVIHDDQVEREPQIICSMGLFPPAREG